MTKILPALFTGIALAAAIGSAHAEGLERTHDAFGTLPDGTQVERYVLSNSHGMKVAVLTYGGIVQSVLVPDRDGKFADVALGFDTLDGYLKHGDVHFGALIGRYANRIAGGSFSLDGKQYQVPLNDKTNALHGGPEGFDTKVWKATPDDGDRKSIGVILTRRSPDGEMGFPGNLDVKVTYTLNESNELTIKYEAKSDKATVVNLTNHSYWNLAGAGEGDVLKQMLQLYASRYTPVNENLIPTGKLEPVRGTPLDFTTLKAIGTHIKDDHPQLKLAEPTQGGFDFNYVLDTSGNSLKSAAEAYDPASGRQMRINTTEPGIQFYSSNFLKGDIQGKGGKTYAHWGAFALETQHYPDSPNQASFPPVRLDAGQNYVQTTIYQFGVR